MRRIQVVVLVIGGAVAPARAFAQQWVESAADTVAAAGSASTTVAQDEPAEVVRSAPVEPIAPPPAEKPIPLLDERTAFMVGKGTLKLGLLAFEYGIIQRLSVGVDPPEFVIRAFANVLVPNAHVKVQLLDKAPVWVAVLAAIYWAEIQSSDLSGNLLDVPLTLYVTVQPMERFYVHLEGTYVFARLFGTGSITNADVGGVAAARAVQTGLMLQYRLTRIFSLTATGRVQVHVTDVPFNGSSQIDPLTTATVRGQIVPGVQYPWEVIGGVAVLWKYFHLIAGVGYGNYFVPGLDVANPKKTVVPDLSLSVVL